MDILYWPEIVSAITNTELLSDGPITVGTKFRETRNISGREASEITTIAKLEEPYR